VKNWKTTATGLISAVAGFIAVSPGLFAKWPVVIEVGKYIAAGGLAAFAISAKDNNVTGGTKPQ
jgi:hypothetical protein